MRACVCVCVVSVIVKRPVLPPSVVDGRSRNPLYYYYQQPVSVLACSTGPIRDRRTKQAYILLNWPSICDDLVAQTIRRGENRHGGYAVHFRNRQTRRRDSDFNSKWGKK